MNGDLETFVANGQAAQRDSDQIIQRVKQSLNTTPLLCRSAVREFLLDEAARSRPFNKFSRVSEETLVIINELVKQACRSHVRRLPSKGKTI